MAVPDRHQLLHPAASRRPRRILSWDHGPAWDPADGDLGSPVEERIFLDPLLHTGSDRDAPASSYGRKEHVALAYVAALQHLTANQRAVLILRDVLSFTAAETADMLDTSVPSVTSALQRARSTVADRAPDAGEGPDPLTTDERQAVDRWVVAWERADVPSIVNLLTEDVRFTMPPLPAWFDGRGDVARFIGERVFATPWRLSPTTANGQPAFACYQGVDGVFRLSAVNVLRFHGGRIDWIAAFLDPQVLRHVDLPDDLDEFPAHR